MATGQYLSELAAALAERGHEVTVVTGRRAYDGSGGKFPANETWRGVRILRAPSTRFGKKSKWRRAADFASFIFSCGAQVAFLQRHDAVVALTTPPLISFIGAWRAKLWRAKFCYWVMDMNPDEAIAAGWLRKDSFAGKILERMSRSSFRSAGKIIALDRFMRDRIAAKGISPEKIIVIPPWSLDGDVRFDAAGREQFRREHGLENKFVVMHAGNHSPVHPLDTLMQAAEQLKDDGSIAFCFVGGGSEFTKVESRKQKAESENWRLKILCLPYQPLAQLSASLSAADAHVVVMGEAMPGLVHPCKIYNILAVGAPVIYIGPQPGHVTEILDHPGDGYPSIRVAHGEAEALADQIQNLRQKTEKGHRLFTGTIAANYSKRVLLPQMIATLEKL